MIVQWRMEGKSLPNVSSIDRRPMRYACWSYSWSLYRCSTVNMLVLRRIAGCFRDRIETIFCRALSSRIPIKDIASSAPHDVSGDITVLGWIKAVRKQKDIVFIDLNDGSTPHNLQIIAATEEFPSAKDFNLGCSLEARGEIVPSSHPGQAVEMTARELKLIGKCNPQEYPFKARKHHGLEYIRQFPHLRPRTNSFSSLLRIRDTATMAIHEFFHKENFLHIHTPILTSSDCEGAGDLFEVKPSRRNSSDEFFGCKAYLTVSGQLQAEALASGMHSVYTFGPTFRAEKSHTRRHLSEFYMVEAETVTMAADMQHLLELIERLYKSTLETVLKRSAADVEYYHNRVTSPEAKEDVKRSLDQPFKRLTYTEAVDILRTEHEKCRKFEFEPRWGEDLQSEHEQFLVDSCGRLPVFITDYPASTKAFYARANDHDSRGQTVAAVDLIVPRVGELVGGSLREERPHLLQDKLERFGLLDQYRWYMDLREFGTVPHGGFGLGFERYLQAILGLDNIRDVIPFPRYLGSCDT